MSLGARRGRRAASALLGGGGGGGFNPLDYGSPIVAYWLSDPSWTPPSADAEITSLRNDGSDGGAATPTTTGPLYRTSGLSGVPAAEFSGNPQYGLSQSFSTSTGMTGSDDYSVVAVFQQDGSGGATQTILSTGSGATGRILLRETSGAYQVYCGSVLATGVSSDTDPHVLVYTHRSSDDLNACRMDGSSAGSVTQNNGLTTGVYLGAQQGNTSNGLYGDLIFAAIYPSTLITGESWFPEYESGLISMVGA